MYGYAVQSGLQIQTLFQIKKKKKKLPFSRNPANPLPLLLIGNPSNDDGNVNENVTWKYNSTLLQLRRDYSNLLKLYNGVEQSRN